MVQEQLYRTNAYVMDQLFMYENTSLELYTRSCREDSLKSSLNIISDLENEKIANEF